MSNLREDCAFRPIGEVILPFQSLDLSKQPKDRFSYIDIGAIDNTCQTITNPRNILGKEAPSRARRLVHTGDILFSTVRTYLKNIAIVPEKFDGAIASTGIAVLRPSADVDGRYLFHWVCSDAFVAGISEAQDGTMYPAIRDSDLYKALIALPPIAEQRVIVSRLESLLARTKDARKELAPIERLASRYKKNIVKLALNGDLTAEARVLHGFPEWVSVKAGNLISWGSGKSLTKKNQRTGKVPVYGGNGIQGWHDEALFDKATIIIGRVGAQCGNVFYSDGTAWITDNAIYAYEVNDQLLPEFAHLIFDSVDLNSLAGGSGQPYVSQTLLNGIEFMLPSRSEQKLICDLFKERLARLAEIRTQSVDANTLLGRLDQSIIHKAFQGELTGFKSAYQDLTPVQTVLQKKRHSHVV